MKVLVLAGGESAEREVSLVSGRAVLDALAAHGHRAEMLDLAPEGTLDPGTAFRLNDALSRVAPDVVFVALHGGIGEGGTVQAFLEVSGVPYTGSGLDASVVAMDKILSKIVMAHIGVATPPWERLGAEPGPDDVTRVRSVGEPWWVVKPNRGGSTVGISIVKADAELPDALALARRYDSQVLVERYVAGRELTVGIVSGTTLPVVEITPRSGFYDYEHKYTEGRSVYTCPADVPETLARTMQAAANDLYVAIGCRGAVRVDFRLGEDGVAYCLEANTVPGLTPMSLLPMGAKAIGLDFPALIERLCTDAISATRSPA